MDYETVLGRLCALAGPSGFESPVVREAAELLRPLADEVKVDRMGSVVALRRCGRENAPRLLLDAHLDEIGFLVTGHEEGFLRIAPLGGVDPRMLPDRELTILTDPPRLGVVACMPPHIQTREEMDKSQPMRELAVDVGLTQEEAQRLIPVGTPAVYRTGCAPLGEDLLCGKALDDRACFAILLDALERLQGEELDVDLYVLGSTQEETHSTGAITAAFGVMPHLCVAVDVTHGDSPDASKDKTFLLRGGPVIGVGPNCTRWMSKRLEEKAGELEMDCQIEVMAGHSGTNGWDLQISREGVATAVLSLPLRYMHTPVETASRADMTACARLLAAFIRGIGKEVPSYD
ncbi:M42 family peptidase [Pseudoflavonifractor phocaeensis]|uniref:M42 family peptidase n=1 Tax=Pseudoflavonifractor phocaeensis TaxID=1870988 RepID=UPI001F479589|nr:M42 family peptidase [Pseudoflavonifractor phocaeensis]MCF2662286.1 M42 family peptidase [Pseudoflavonifractor phocaeensis]